MQPMPHHAMRIQRQEEPSQMGPEVISITNEVLAEMDLKRWEEGEEEGEREGVHFKWLTKNTKRKTKITPNQKPVNNLQKTSPTI